MSDKDTGGPTFPSNEMYASSDTIAQQFTGITMRDYFAAKALPAILRQEDGGIQSHCPSSHVSAMSDLRISQIWAEHAYQIADAMIAERAK